MKHRSIHKIERKLMLMGASMLVVASTSTAQVSSKGLSPPANTYRSYQDASIARDSGLNQPLNLLNDFYPSIEVRIEDHQNVRRRPDRDESDLKLTARPSLGYRTNIGRHQFYAAYNGTFVFHKELEQEDVNSNSVSAKLGLDVSRRWDINLFGSVGDSFEERGVSGTREFDLSANGGRDIGPDRIESKSWGADLIYGGKLGVLTAVLGIEQSDSGFRSVNGGGAILAGNRDRETGSVHFDLSYLIGSKTSVFGRIQQTETDFERAQNSLDSEQLDYSVGLRWKASNALSGVIAYGRTDKEFDEAGRAGFNGSNYYTNLNYAFSPFSSLQISASRTLEEPSDIDSSFYQSELLGASWSHALTDQLVFNVYGKLIDDDYDTGREDQFVDWGVGLDYAWKRWLTVGVYYGDIERESTLKDIDYDDQFIGIRLSSDLRKLGRRDTKKHVEPHSFGRTQKSVRAQ